MTVEEITDAELVEPEPGEPGFRTGTTAALVPVIPVSAVVQPVVGVQGALDAFRAHAAMVEKIVTAEDKQIVGSGQYAKSFITKSGWRKLATVYSVSDEIRDRLHDRDEHGRIIRSEVVARAIAPNGRYSEGLGACDYRERCCPKAYGEPCKKSGHHFHCEQGCTGFLHFSKPQHDIPATAHTRSKNRALSDLFGFGEVSAEEVTDREEPAATEVVKEIIGAFDAIEDDDQRASAKHAFVRMFGAPGTLTEAQVGAARRFVLSVGGKFAGDAAPAPASAALADVGPPVRPRRGEVGEEEVGSSGVEAAPVAVVPSSEAVKESGEHSASQPNGGGTPAPANNGQKQRIAMLFGALTRTCSECTGRRGHKKNDPPVHDPSCTQKEPMILVPDDKATLTQIISGDPDRASTVDLTHDEAVLYLAMLRHFENVTLRMEGEGDERIVVAVTPSGEAFLDQVLKTRAVQ